MISTVRCRGKCFTTLAELQAATDDILKRYQVEGVTKCSMRGDNRETSCS